MKLVILGIIIMLLFINFKLLFKFRKEGLLDSNKKRGGVGGFNIGSGLFSFKKNKKKKILNDYLNFRPGNNIGSTPLYRDERKPSIDINTPLSFIKDHKIIDPTSGKSGLGIKSTDTDTLTKNEKRSMELEKLKLANIVEVDKNGPIYNTVSYTTHEDNTLEDVIATCKKNNWQTRKLSFNEKRIMKSKGIYGWDKKPLEDKPCIGFWSDKNNSKKFNILVECDNDCEMLDIKPLNKNLQQMPPQGEVFYPGGPSEKVGLVWRLKAGIGAKASLSRSDLSYKLINIKDTKNYNDGIKNVEIGKVVEINKSFSSSANQCAQGSKIGKNPCIGMLKKPNEGYSFLYKSLGSYGPKRAGIDKVFRKKGNNEFEPVTPFEPISNVKTMKLSNFLDQQTVFNNCLGSDFTTDKITGEVADTVDKGKTSFQCEPGFSPTNNGEITCTNGLWDIQTCGGSPCDSNFEPTHGVAGGAGTAAGSKFTFECAQSYTASGQATCNNGSWDSPTCIKNTCTTAFTTTNGKAGGTGTAHGLTYTFKCKQGYTPSGAATCTNGSWNSPTCRPNNCTTAFKTRRSKGGVNAGRNTGHGRTYTFKCEQGYAPSGVATCAAGNWDSPTCEKIPEIENCRANRDVWKGKTQNLDRTFSQNITCQKNDTIDKCMAVKSTWTGINKNKNPCEWYDNASGKIQRKIWAPPIKGCRSTRAVPGWMPQGLDKTFSQNKKCFNKTFEDCMKARPPMAWTSTNKNKNLCEWYEDGVLRRKMWKASPNEIKGCRANRDFSSWRSQVGNKEFSQNKTCAKSETIEQCFGNNKPFKRVRFKNKNKYPCEWYEDGVVRRKTETNDNYELLQIG